MWPREADIWYIRELPIGGSGTLLALPSGIFANKTVRPSSLIHVPMDEHSSGLFLPEKQSWETWQWVRQSRG